MKTPTRLKQLAKEKLSPSAFFLLLICTAELVTLAMAFIVPGRVFAEILFINRSDSYMDYFHSVMANEQYSINNLYYSANLFYPPLASLFYLVMYALIPQDAVPHNNYIARELQATAIPFLLLTILTSVAMIYILSALRKGTGVEKKLFSLSVLLCAPMLYQLDRGNILILALLCSLLFFHWKDSESRVKRELALVCLALAAGLKIYPALFGLILVFEKRWSEAVRCVFYGLLAFFLPGIVFGGITPIDMLENLQNMSSGTQREGFGYKVNFTNTFAFLCHLCHIPHPAKFFSALSTLLCALSFGSVFFLDKNWKRICAMTIPIVALPGFSYAYTMLFMLIPAVFFLNENDTPVRAPLKYVYAGLLALCFMPLPFTDIHYAEYHIDYPMTVTTFAEGLSLLILASLLIVEAGIVLFRRLRALQKKRDVQTHADAES